MEASQSQRTALLAKITDLMDYRMLPDLIDLVEQDTDKKRQLISKLVDLQVAIYDLDHYLETHWQLSEDHLETYWVPIYDALDAAGVPRNEHSRYAAHILKYQKHEMQLRDLVLPTRLDMQYFYFYKSCDVKLLRRIIMLHYPALAKMYRPADWRVFDMITEVDDDVEDVLEDRETINGNRYLISIWQHGFDHTQQAFAAFLDMVEDMMQKRFGSQSTTFHSDLLAWSRAALDSTRTRLLTTSEPDLSDKAIWLRNRVPLHVDL
jgi:hypothetical protein